MADEKPYRLNEAGPEYFRPKAPADVEIYNHVYLDGRLVARHMLERKPPADDDGQG